MNAADSMIILCGTAFGIGLCIWAAIINNTPLAILGFSIIYVVNQVLYSE